MTPSRPYRAASIALTCCVAITTACAPEARREESSDVLAIVNAALYPVSSEAIENGTLLVEDGRITALGSDVDVPSGARVIDARGASVIPGLVESHSHMGFKQLNIPSTGRNNNELSEPINAQVRAIDGLNSNDAAFTLALASGVTTMNITTGSRSPNSGQAVVVKLRGGTVSDMFLAHGGMKFAMRADGEFSNFPDTVDGVYELLVSHLRSARDYVEAGSAAADSGEKPPARDLTHEAFAKLLSREWVVGVHTSDKLGMEHAIALKKEFGLDLYIHHGRNTDELVDELVEAEVPVSFGPILPFMGTENPRVLGPVRLAAAGGVVAFHADHPDAHQYFLRHAATMFVRKGMSRSDALRALTLNPASLFGLDSRIGSLEPGKDADFVFLEGPPLEFESLVSRVFIDGVEVFNRATGDNVFGQRVPEGW